MYKNKFEEYLKIYKKQRTKAYKQYELKNCERFLRGLKKEKFIFKGPPPPIYHMFICKSIIKNNSRKNDDRTCENSIKQ